MAEVALTVTLVIALVPLAVLSWVEAIRAYTELRATRRSGAPGAAPLEPNRSGVQHPPGRDSMIFDIVRLRAQQAELHERLVRVEGWILNNSQGRLGTRDRARPRE